MSQTIKLSGTVRDAQSFEPVIGAVVYAPNHQRGVATDERGRFSITLNADSATLVFRIVGYTAYQQAYKQSADKLIVQLRLVQQSEVVIQTDKETPKEKVRRAQMSLEHLDISEIKNLPAIFGEVDILKILQLKPGVQSGGEGASGLYVRGGGPDQNLFLIDEAVIYNPNHLFGFFSVFNSDAVQSIDLYKGGFPAQYGGRLSSVVDVKMRPGNFDSLAVTGGLGLISSRLTVEGPIKKGKSSYIFSARRTYFDVFTRQYNRVKEKENNPEFQPIPDYYFYDFNGRISLDVTPRDRVFITGYYGQDVFGFQRRQFKFNFTWGNQLLSTRWVHKHSKQAFSEASLTYTNYDYQVSNQFDIFQFKLGSGIRDVTGRLQWNYESLTGHELKAGVTGTKHLYTLGRAQGGSSDNSFSFKAGQQLEASEFGAYFSDKFSPTRSINLEAGARLSGFSAGKDLYMGIEPRFQGSIMVTPDASVKVGYGRMYQYQHLITSSGANLPTDLWYPSNGRVLPQISDQINTGYSFSLFNDQLFFSNEYYYKNLQRQVDFMDGANLFLNQRLDTTFVFGRGYAYGTEFYLEKKKGRTTGWIGYTLSWTWRQFNDINDGKPFHPRYDRRHDISVVVTHKLNKRITISGTWVFGTGNAVTLPFGRAVVQDIPGTVSNPPGITPIPLYGARNSYRMAPYHRADISMVYLVGKRRKNDLTFSVYNVYSRMNPYFIYIETKTLNPDGSGQITGFEAKQVSLFPIIPSVTYNFRY